MKLFYNFVKNNEMSLKEQYKNKIAKLVSVHLKLHELDIDLENDNELYSIHRRVKSCIVNYNKEYIQKILETLYANYSNIYGKVWYMLPFTSNQKITDIDKLTSTLLIDGIVDLYESDILLDCVKQQTHDYKQIYNIESIINNFVHTYKNRVCK